MNGGESLPSDDVQGTGDADLVLAGGHLQIGRAGLGVSLGGFNCSTDIAPDIQYPRQIDGELIIRYRTARPGVSANGVKCM